MTHIPGAPASGHSSEAGSLTGTTATNVEFGQGNVTQDRQAIQREFAPDPFGWAEFVSGRVIQSMGQYGELNGLDLEFIKLKYSTWAAPMIDAIYTELFAEANEVQQNFLGTMPISFLTGVADMSSYGIRGIGAAYYKTDAAGLEEMTAWALQWMAAKTGFDLQPFVKSGSGSRGSGRRGLTEQEIRNQFDLEALAGAINDMNRGLVLEEHGNAKGLARKYVDAIVATKAEKEIDFETFVRTRIEDTARFKSIYKRKPKSVSAEAYIAPYLQAALQMASPDEAADIAIGGAQFGASTEVFRQRLARTDNATASSPFINALESRMTDLSQILRG